MCGQPRLKQRIDFFIHQKDKKSSIQRHDKIKRTSYTEYEVDALALKTEEGRGDRRNVWGELHASDEPQDSE
jgi:hypothetical protein